MFIRKEDFNEVKIIPSILVYLLMNFGIIFVIEIIDDSFLDKNTNVVQLIIDCLFILYLFFKFGVNFRKLNKLIHDFIEKINIKDIVFDRGGYIYHGVVKEVAEAAREGGLNF